MENRNSLASAASVAFLVLLLASLAGRYLAENQAMRYSGPTHIAAGHGQVFVFAADRVYRLSAAGKLLAQFPLSQAGLDDVPIDAHVLGPGRLLIASQRPAQVRLCDTGNLQCERWGLGEGKLPRRQFKVLPDMAASDQPQASSVAALWFTDAHGDDLGVWSGPGLAARSLLPPQTLAGPNDLARDAQGHMWVADTDNRRIVEFMESATGEWQTARQHSALNDYTQGKNYFPMMLAAGGDGNWWVTQASEFSDARADLVVYHPDRGAIALVPLPGSRFATDIVALDGDLLVTDLDAYAVFRIDAQSHKAGLFGDTDFQTALQQLRDERLRYQSLSQWSMMGVVLSGVLMIAFAVLATPRAKRWTPTPEAIRLEASDAPMPQIRGVYWLKTNPAMERALKLAQLIGLVAITVLVGGMAVLYLVMRVQFGDAGDAPPAELTQLGWLLLLVLAGTAVLVPFGVQTLRVWQHRIGTNGASLYIRLKDGREVIAPPSELAFTPRAILYRQYLLPLHNAKRQSLYAEGELEKWLAPLLQEAHKLSHWQGIQHQWKHRNALMLWSIAVVLAGGLLVAAATMINR